MRDRRASAEKTEGGKGAGLEGVGRGEWFVRRLMAEF